MTLNDFENIWKVVVKLSRNGFLVFIVGWQLISWQAVKWVVLLTVHTFEWIYELNIQTGHPNTPSIYINGKKYRQSTTVQNCEDNKDEWLTKHFLQLWFYPYSGWKSLLQVIPLQIRLCHPKETELMNAIRHVLLDNDLGVSDPPRLG